MKQQLLGLFLGTLLSTTVFAAGGAINPILDDRFTFRLGATHMDAEGTFSSTIKGNPTDDLSTDDLGIDDGSTNPYFGFRWRFADRWRLTFNYFGMDNDGGVRKNFDELIFGHIEAKGFLAVDTNFETDFYVTQVGYSFLKNERGELGVGAGLHVVDFNARLKVSGEINGKGGYPIFSGLAPMHLHPDCRWIAALAGSAWITMITAVISYQSPPISNIV